MHHSKFARIFPDGLILDVSSLAIVSICGGLDLPHCAIVSCCIVGNQCSCFLP